MSEQVFPIGGQKVVTTAPRFGHVMAEQKYGFEFNIVITTGCSKVVFVQVSRECARALGLALIAAVNTT